MENKPHTPLQPIKLLLLGIFGALFLGFGSYSLVDNMIASITGVYTTGIVVHQKLGSNFKSTYPIVVFRLEDGSKTTQELDQRFGDYRVNNSIEIIYQKDNNTNVRVNDGFWLYFFPIVMSFFGLILIVDPIKLGYSNLLLNRSVSNQSEVYEPGVLDSPF